jgi:hypothetical protein
MAAASSARVVGKDDHCFAAKIREGARLAVLVDQAEVATKTSAGHVGALKSGRRGATSRQRQRKQQSCEPAHRDAQCQ